MRFYIKFILILFGLLQLLSCGNNNNSTLNNILISQKMNNSPCVNCAILSYSEKILVITLNSNIIDNDCLGDTQIIIDDNKSFMLPNLGEIFDYNLESNVSSCSMKNANVLYIKNNSGMYEISIGNYVFLFNKEKN